MRTCLSAIVWIGLVSLPGLAPCDPAAATPAATGVRLGSRTEQEWRSAFRTTGEALSQLEACRARLPDYCSWEYYRSHQESEVRAVQDYIAARRRGEDADHPLAGKVFVPEPCQQLFDRRPGEHPIELSADAADSCLARVNALVAGIDAVGAYWTEHLEQLEREARAAAVPHPWRSRGDGAQGP